MRKVPLGRTLSLALLSLSLAACASRGGGVSGEMSEGAEATGDRVSVQVTNDIVPGRTVVVWIVPETGSRRRLGTVPPNGTGNFTYFPGARSTDHRLVAELEGGGSETSIGFTLLGVSGVRWDLSNPRVRLVR